MPANVSSMTMAGPAVTVTGSVTTSKGVATLVVAADPGSGRVASTALFDVTVTVDGANPAASGIVVVPHGAWVDAFGVPGLSVPAPVFRGGYDPTTKSWALTVSAPAVLSPGTAAQMGVQSGASVAMQADLRTSTPALAISVAGLNGAVGDLPLAITGRTDLSSFFPATTATFVLAPEGGALAGVAPTTGYVVVIQGQGVAGAGIVATWDPRAGRLRGHGNWGTLPFPGAVDGSDVAFDVGLAAGTLDATATSQAMGRPLPVTITYRSAGAGCPCLDVTLTGGDTSIDTIHVSSYTMGWHRHNGTDFSTIDVGAVTGTLGPVTLTGGTGHLDWTTGRLLLDATGTVAVGSATTAELHLTGSVTLSATNVVGVDLTTDGSAVVVLDPSQRVTLGGALHITGSWDPANSQLAVTIGGTLRADLGPTRGSVVLQAGVQGSAATGHFTFGAAATVTFTGGTRGSAVASVTGSVDLTPATKALRFDVSAAAAMTTPWTVDLTAGGSVGFDGAATLHLAGQVDWNGPTTTTTATVNGSGHLAVTVASAPGADAVQARILGTLAAQISDHTISASFGAGTALTFGASAATVTVAGSIDLDLVHQRAAFDVSASAASASPWQLPLDPAAAVSLTGTAALHLQGQLDWSQTTPKASGTLSGDVIAQLSNTRGTTPVTLHVNGTLSATRIDLTASGGATVFGVTTSVAGTVAVDVAVRQATFDVTFGAHGTVLYGAGSCAVPPIAIDGGLVAHGVADFSGPAPGFTIAITGTADLRLSAASTTTNSHIDFTATLTKNTLTITAAGAATVLGISTTGSGTVVIDLAARTATLDLWLGAAGQLDLAGGAITLTNGGLHATGTVVFALCPATYAIAISGQGDLHYAKPPAGATAHIAWTAAVANNDITITATGAASVSTPIGTLTGTDLGATVHVSGPTTTVTYTGTLTGTGLLTGNLSLAGTATLTGSTLSFGISAHGQLSTLGLSLTNVDFAFNPDGSWSGSTDVNIGALHGSGAHIAVTAAGALDLDVGRLAAGAVTVDNVRITIGKASLWTATGTLQLGSVGAIAITINQPYAGPATATGTGGNGTMNGWSVTDVAVTWDTTAGAVNVQGTVAKSGWGGIPFTGSYDRSTGQFSVAVTANQLHVGQFTIINASVVWTDQALVVDGTLTTPLTGNVLIHGTITAAGAYDLKSVAPGTMNIRGIPVTAASIDLTNTAGLTVRATVTVGEFGPVPLQGSISATGQFSLQIDTANTTGPFTLTAYDHNTTLTNATIHWTEQGLAGQLTLSGDVTLATPIQSFTGTGLVATATFDTSSGAWSLTYQGTVSAHGVLTGSVTVSGSIVTSATHAITRNLVLAGNLTLLGDHLDNIMLLWSNDSLIGTGTASFGMLANIPVAVDLEAAGTWSVGTYNDPQHPLAITTQGFGITNIAVRVTQSGFQASGTIHTPWGDVPIPFTRQTNGSYLAGGAGSTPATGGANGFPVNGLRIDWDGTTGTLSAQATVTVPKVGPISVRGTYQGTTNSWDLAGDSGPNGVTPGGVLIKPFHLEWTNAALAVSGTLVVGSPGATNPLFTVPIAGRFNADGSFAVHGSLPVLTFGPFKFNLVAVDFTQSGVVVTLLGGNFGGLAVASGALTRNPDGSWDGSLSSGTLAGAALGRLSVHGGPGGFSVNGSAFSFGPIQGASFTGSYNTDDTLDLQLEVLTIGGASLASLHIHGAGGAWTVNGGTLRVGPFAALTVTGTLSGSGLWDLQASAGALGSANLVGLRFHLDPATGWSLGAGILTVGPFSALAISGTFTAGTADLSARAFSWGGASVAALALHFDPSGWTIRGGALNVGPLSGITISGTFTATTIDVDAGVINWGSWSLLAGHLHGDANGFDLTSTLNAGDLHFPFIAVHFGADGTKNLSGSFRVLGGLLGGTVAGTATWTPTQLQVSALHLGFNAGPLNIGSDVNGAVFRSDGSFVVQGTAQVWLDFGTWLGHPMTTTLASVPYTWNSNQFSFANQFIQLPVPGFDLTGIGGTFDTAGTWQVCGTLRQWVASIIVNSTRRCLGNGTPAPPALVAGDDSISPKYNNASTVNVLTNDYGTAASNLSVVAPTNRITTGHGSAVCVAAGTCTYTPTANYSGSDSFRYTAYDKGSGDYASATVYVTIAAPPAGPIARNDSYTVNYNSSNSFAIKTNDSGIRTKLNVYNQPHYGSVDCDTNGACTYWAGTGHTGWDAFTYNIVDDYGQVSNTATVTVTTLLPAAPVAGTYTVSLDDSAVHPLYPLSVSKGVGLRITSVGTPTFGTLTCNTANCTFNAHGYDGDAYASFQVTDQFGRTSSGTIHIVSFFQCRPGKPC